MGGRPFATLPGRPPTELTSIFTYSLSFTLVALDLTIGVLLDLSCNTFVIFIRDHLVLYCTLRGPRMVRYTPGNVVFALYSQRHNSFHT